MPKISVIIPVYNVEKYLRPCLDSVLVQTFKDFEVICVNDGSTDNSAQILAEYERKDDRIKIINQENQGLSMARNNGLTQAQGKYIYFMDSDDAIHPQTLEILYFFITKYNADMVCFDFTENIANKLPNVSAIKKENIKYSLTDKPLYFKQNGNLLHINVCTKFYRKEILSGLEFIPHIQFEDYPHTLAIWAKCPKTIILNEKLYFYTMNGNSISHSKAKLQQIKDYHTGMIFVYNIYHKPKLEDELQYICRTYIPNILKQQLGRCKRADKEIRAQMYEAFAEELRDLKAKGMLSWRGHKLIRYFNYLIIMRRFR